MAGRRVRYIAPVLVAAAVLLVAACVPPPNPAVTNHVTLPVAKHQRVMLMGDSMAFDLRHALERHAAANKYTAAPRGMIGCGVGYNPFPSQNAAQAEQSRRQCATNSTPTRDNVAGFAADIVVVFRIVSATPGTNGSPKLHECSPEYLNWYTNTVRSHVTAAANGGAITVLVTAPYNRWGGLVFENDDDRVDCHNSALRDIAATTRGAALVDLGGWTCPTRTCRTHHNGVVLRPDGLHYTGAGADIAWRHIWSRVTGK